MWRITLTRSVLVSQTVRCARPSVLPRTALYRSARYESQDARKEWLEKNDDLQRDWDAKELSYEELKPKTQQPTPDKYLIDVREPDEVRLGTIPSAVNLPLSVLSGALHLKPDTFKAQYGFDKPQKDQEIVFYCRSGKRSTTACDVAKRNGFTNLLNYKGSWLDWVEREGIKPV
ncbi:Rhodanese-like protein [Amylocystis lapponica]|nr:Rhodanese-like protein [Amylocystis lapponica]KAH9950522.1 Rhodanese-like protein [Amylocystis lapponica]